METSTKLISTNSCYISVFITAVVWILCIYVVVFYNDDTISEKMRVGNHKASLSEHQPSPKSNVILLWDKFFESSDWALELGPLQNSMCNYSSCVTTTNRSFKM